MALERDTDEGEAGVDPLLPHLRVRDVMVAQLSDGTVALVDTATVFLHFHIYVIHHGSTPNIYYINRHTYRFSRTRASVM